MGSNDLCGKEDWTQKADPYIFIIVGLFGAFGFGFMCGYAVLAR